MKKNLPLIVIGLLILLAISSFIAVKFKPDILVAVPTPKTTDQTKSTSTDIFFFFRSDCPHCLKVEQFLADNNVEQKLKIDKKQVFADKETPESDLLLEKAHLCNINSGDVGVPFVWDGATSKCYMGDEEVINYFKGKANQ